MCAGHVYIMIYAERQGRMQMDNPGSEKAIKKGCTCNPMNNHYGKGFNPRDHGPIFWKDPDCPLHGADIESLKEIINGKQERH